MGAGIAPRNNPHPKKGLCGAGKAQLGPGWGDKDVTPTRSCLPPQSGQGFAQPSPGNAVGKDTWNTPRSTSP